MLTYPIGSPEHHEWKRHQERMALEERIVKATEAATAAAERSQRTSTVVAWCSLGVAASGAVAAVVALFV